MTITRTQSVSGGTDNTTLTKTLTSIPATGALVVVSASFYNNTALVAPTVGGFSCTQSFTPQDTSGGGGDYVIQWYLIIPSTAPNGDVVFATSNYYEVGIVEYASTTGWPANPITASGATPAKPTGSGTTPTASLTTTAADCVIVSNFSNGNDSSGDNGTPAATGYTRDYTATFSEGGAGASKIVTSAGSQSATHTAASSINWACAIVAYAANTGGGTLVDVDAGTDTPALTDSNARNATFGRLGSDTIALTDLYGNPGTTLYAYSRATF